MKKKHRTGGPRTEAGKAKCAQNAIKHGATSARMFVLNNENPEAWNQVLAATVRDYAPTSDVEHAYVEAIALGLWRLRRIWAIQTCAIDLEMESQAEEFANTFDNADEVVRITLAMQAMTANDQTLARLARYETAIQRAHDRAVRNLKNFRDMRAEAADAETSNLEITKQTPEPLNAPAAGVMPETPHASTPAPVRAQSPDSTAPIPPTPVSRESHLPENTSVGIWRPSCPKEDIRVDPAHVQTQSNH